jgi:hypothetical protein
MSTLVGALASCGAADERPLSPLPVPPSTAVRSRAIDATGERIYGELTRGDPVRLLADDLALRELVSPSAASRYSALRLGTTARLSVQPEDFRPLHDATYGGVCLQGSRLEPAHATLGLARDGWVFDRALVMGVQPGGRRLASWVEGIFVYTTDGFVALALNRVESPRWEHADLELAACDMEVGIQHPRHVVGVTD